MRNWLYRWRTRCSNCNRRLTAPYCSQPNGYGGIVTGHWVSGGPCQGI